MRARRGGKEGGAEIYSRLRLPEKATVRTDVFTNVARATGSRRRRSRPVLSVLTSGHPTGVEEGNKPRTGTGRV